MSFLGSDKTSSIFDIHALREDLYQELHTRPFPMLPSPVKVSHLALLNEGHSVEDEYEALAELAKRYSGNPPGDASSCYYQDFGGFEVRWEKHTEFSTYTIITPAGDEANFDKTALEMVPESWLSRLPGKLVVGVHLLVIDEQNVSTRKEDIKPLFEGQRLIGGYTQDDLATVWTSFRLHSDHFSRVLVHRRKLNPCQSGRLVQRLLEIETYRVMALMALPIAREVSAGVNAMDQELAQINAQISDIQHGEDERQLLKQLTTLAAKVERFHSDTNYRFGATNAYYELVASRMAYLKLDEVEGVQSIPEFLMRRLTPAIRTCESAHRRLEDLSNRIGRAGELLNTRVDLTLKEQNQGLLESMNQRSEIQLRLQQMVEGMSVAAISFALVGLIRIALTAIKDGGWIDINLPLMVGLSVPTVVVVVWTVSRHVRKRLTRPRTLD
jgi:uncharacterized membrane-anchored protein